MRRALVVGLNDYPGFPLRGCVNDANSIASVLESHGDGSPNFAIKLVTEASELTRPRLRAAIEAVFGQECDLALFYFSGHGTVGGSGGKLVTSDFEQYDEGVSMDEILNFANQSKAREKIILLDCCFSGQFGTPVGGSGTTQLCEGVSVLTACRKSEPAIESDGRGVFTSLVVDALKGGASDLRGFITPGGIYAYVDQALGPFGPLACTRQ